MIADDTLLMLAFGELPSAEADAAEEHILACSACAARLERVISIGNGVRDLIEAGKAWMVLSPELLARLGDANLVSRTFRIRPGETVHCSVTRSDVYMLTRLEADLTRAHRVDLIVDDTVRIEDVPFVRDHGEVVFVERSDHVRTLPTRTIRFALVAVDDAGESALGEYALSHTAFAPDA